MCHPIGGCGSPRVPSGWLRPQQRSRHASRARIALLPRPRLDSHRALGALRGSKYILITRACSPTPLRGDKIARILKHRFGSKALPTYYGGAADAQPVRRSEDKETRNMRKLVVGTFVTLDGVMQAPGGPNEDRDSGFQHGGWLVPYLDEKFGEIMTEWTKRADGDDGWGQRFGWPNLLAHGAEAPGGRVGTGAFFDQPGAERGQGCDRFVDRCGSAGLASDLRFEGRYILLHP